METTLPQSVFLDSLFLRMKNTWYFLADQFPSSLILSSQDVPHALVGNNSSIFLLLSISPKHASPSTQSALSQDCIFVGVIRIVILSYHDLVLLAYIISLGLKSIIKEILLKSIDYFFIILVL